MFTLLKIRTLFYILQNSPRKGDLVDIHTHPSPSITYKTCNINQLKKKKKQTLLLYLILLLTTPLYIIVLSLRMVVLYNLFCHKKAGY